MILFQWRRGEAERKRAEEGKARMKRTRGQGTKEEGRNQAQNDVCGYSVQGDYSPLTDPHQYVDA